MLIRILEIAPSSGNFHFGKGEIQHFVEVDWFRDDNGPDLSTEQGKSDISKFIQYKHYFDPNKAYLILHPTHSFTIGYEAP